MANDTLKTELPDTSAWKPDWTDSFKTQSTSPESTNVALNAVLDLVDPNVNTEAVNALNQFGGAYGTSFSLAGTGPTNPLYQPTEEDKGLLDDLGDISDIDMLHLFANLIETGMAWSLQGHYGRNAQAFIEQDWIDNKGVMNAEKINEIFELN